MRHVCLCVVASFIVLLSCFTSQSFAGEEGLYVNHRVHSVLLGETETSVFLEVTVRNSGAIDLSDITLIFNENGLFVDPTSQGLYISSLAAGEETTSSWEITSHPNPQIESFLAGDISVTAAAFDADAQSVTIQVNSRGGAE